MTCKCGTSCQDLGEYGECRYITIACSCCGGDGGHFEDGGSTRWTRCTACNGDGELEVEAEVIGVDDLEFGPIYTRHTP